MGSASRLLRHALRPRRSATDSKVLFLWLSLALGGCGDGQWWRYEPSSTLVPPGGAEVPMELVDGVPVIPVFLNGRGPFRFAIDTAAPLGALVFRDGAAGDVGAAGETAGGTGGGAANASSVTAWPALGKSVIIRPPRRIRSVQIGGARLKDVLAAAADWAGDVHATAPRAGGDPGPAPPRPPFDGVLALPQFRRCLLTLDYPRRRVRLDRGSLSEEQATEFMHPHRQDQGRGLEMRVVVGSRPEFCTLSTGVGEGLVLRPDYNGPPPGLAPFPAVRPETLSVVLQPWQRLHRLARVGRLSEPVRLGRAVITDPVVWLDTESHHRRIGGELLRHFVVTVDSRNRRMRLARPDNAPVHAPVTMASPSAPGVYMRPEAAAWVVTAVTPDPASQALGLKTDDRILSINGIKVANLSDFYMLASDVINPRSFLDLEIERDGAVLKFDPRKRPHRLQQSPTPSR